METETSKGKETRIPGPDHPITISPAEGGVRVTVAGRIVAESTRALRLEEKGYPVLRKNLARDHGYSFPMCTGDEVHTKCPALGSDNPAAPYASASEDMASV
jgi:uncharacterized protein (DUF427 family)